MKARAPTELERDVMLCLARGESAYHARPRHLRRFITSTCNRLYDRGLVTFAKLGGVELTEQGREIVRGIDPTALEPKA